MTDRYELQHCSECSKLMHEYDLYRCEDHTNMTTKYICPDCLKKLKGAEHATTEVNLDPPKESSKPATDGTYHVVYEQDSKPVNIHKIIDDAMEKKDRSVTIFIGKDATTVSVYPYEDKAREWMRLKDDKGVTYAYVCPECGLSEQYFSQYCPSCGEKLKRPT